MAESTDISSGEPISASELTADITRLETGLPAVKYEGDYGFEEFLANGGASSDEDVVNHLSRNVLLGASGLSFGNMPFGCSTISVKSENGDHLFGRNFDWNKQRFDKCQRSGCRQLKRQFRSLGQQHRNRKQ